MNKNIKVPLRIVNVEKEIARTKSWKISDEDKKDVQAFLREVEIGKITGNIMKPNSLGTYILNLKIGLESLNKPTNKLKETDVDNFCADLLKNNIGWIKRKRDENGKTIEIKEGYAELGKDRIKDTLINYLEWKLGNKAAVFIKMLKIRPKIKETTPDFLREGEVESLYKNCKNSRERFLISVLFDGGMRAEEFHNLRFEDVDLKEDKVKITLKGEYSKTKGRTIGLYWKYSFEAVRDYLEERKKSS